MEMKNLKQLHRSMMEQGIDAQHFRVEIGAGQFDCLFATGDARPVLTLASGGARPKLFTFEVRRGYGIDAFLGSMYNDLRDLYVGKANSTRKLQSRDFFEALHDQIPTEASTDMIPTPDQTAKFHPGETP